MATKLSNPWVWLTVEEVAVRVGLSEERVRQLIRAKAIKATKIGGWLIRPQDLDAFIHSRTNVDTQEKSLQS
ncbi:MAG: helix-turn-helix domain-containing protein [Candidatus Omnitrophica bacterium]|nr:helix-turn-helix domain-containing protein [Candidatus Omnitrophota bacterium]